MQLLNSAFHGGKNRTIIRLLDRIKFEKLLERKLIFPEEEGGKFEGGSSACAGPAMEPATPQQASRAVTSTSRPRALRPPRCQGLSAVGISQAGARTRRLAGDQTQSWRQRPGRAACGCFFWLSTGAAAQEKAPKES